jgi:hypothetical protein
VSSIPVTPSRSDQVGRALLGRGAFRGSDLASGRGERAEPSAQLSLAQTP